jgi:short-subunit dehydrogenase involved in D-alanine esterification of teichoic acids
MNLSDMKDHCAGITGGATGPGFAVAQRILVLSAHIHLGGRGTTSLDEAADRWLQGQPNTAKCSFFAGAVFDQSGGRFTY